MFPTLVPMTHRNLKRIGFFGNAHRLDTNNISFTGKSSAGLQQQGNAHTRRYLQFSMH